MRTKMVMVAAMAGMLAGPAFAEGGETSVDLRYGEQSGISQRALSLRFGDIWSRSGERWTMRLQPVVEAGHLRYRGSRASNDSLNYGSLALGFRAATNHQKLRPYFEAGLGGAYFSQTSLGPRSLSTRFQFTEWIGVGLDIGKHVSIGWRYVHFSNANIKKPNDGIDLQQVVLSARF